MANDTVVA